MSNVCIKTLLGETLEVNIGFVFVDRFNGLSMGTKVKYVNYPEVVTCRVINIEKPNKVTLQVVSIVNKEDKNKQVVDIDFSTMSKNELLDYGRNTLGLKIDGRRSIDYIREIVETMYYSDYVE